MDNQAQSAVECWDVTAERGFLICPDPLTDLALVDSGLDELVVEHLETLAADLPDVIADGWIRAALDALPVYDLSGVQPAQAVERLHLLYTYFASAYVHMGGAPLRRIPKGVALPLVALSQRVERPPMLSYAGMVLNNWKRTNPAGDFSLENLELLQTFTRLYDEQWFFLVHVAIEARAGRVVDALRKAMEAAGRDDASTVLTCLREIRQGLVEVVKIFHRVPEHCDPDRYYQQVRLPLFGLKDVVFEGVTSEPQSFMGGSGAQSSIIPAVLAGLGVKHQHSELTHYLTAIRSYMPRQHHAVMDGLTTDALRNYCKLHLHLQDAYNHCLHQVMTFRRAHFYYARTYIFEKSTEAVGTGGTAFMQFLNALIQETQDYLL